MKFNRDEIQRDALGRITGDDIDFTHEETYRLALESCERWLGNYRLSPAMRLRALRAVVETALSDQSV